MSAIESLTVRMYRQLLGDCFLVRVKEKDGPERRILIDCGLLQGLENGKKRISAVAQNIVDTCSTGGAGAPDGCTAFIDLVVATHQHFDHVGGFIQAKDILLDPKVVFGELWMAWTEDPQDQKANELRGAFEKRGFAMLQLCDAIAKAPANEKEALADLADLGILQLSRFVGTAGNDAEGSKPPRGRLSVATVMDALKAKAAKVRFLSPGQVVETPGDTPLQVAVLGPPKADSRLFQDLPSQGPDKETYLTEVGANLSFLALGQENEARDPIDLGSPFARKYWSGLERAAIEGGENSADDTVHWLHARYFAENDPSEGRTQQYRRIDKEWLDPISSLALNLDSDTNNTSLVLAFRLPDGTFMLFAADAQVGNWLSWHDQSYHLPGGELTAEQILNRTRLYKVGHHGSENATLRKQGLEMMTHDGLTAMCSTVAEEALKQGKKGWQMPNERVKAPLLAQSGGRFLRGDLEWGKDPDTKPYRQANADFASRLTEGPEHDGTPLFVELRVI